MHNITYHGHIAKKYIPNQRPLTRAPSQTSITEQSNVEVEASQGNSQENPEPPVPPPPSDISKADHGTWVAWTHKTEKEIIREAASKKFIPLAEKYLCLQKNADLDHIKELISKETLSWVDELLNRKLIFRASNIIDNIGLNSLEELQKLFYKTVDRERREYIGNHLRSKDALPDNYEQLWRFLDVILDNKVFTRHDRLPEDSIETLEQQSDTWKDFVAAKLFLGTKDPYLVDFVKPQAMWKQLLASNNVETLKSWIKLAFCPQPGVLNIPEELESLLKTLPITEEMLADLANANLPPDSFETILNELAKFGVFIESERVSLVKVLARLQSANGISNVYDILGLQCSSLPLVKFMSMLVNYCLDRELFVVLNSCTDNFDLEVLQLQKPVLNLLCSFRRLGLSFEERELCNNLVKVSSYLSNDDLVQYFNEHPLILLSVLLFNDVSVEQVFKDQSLMVSGREVFNCFLNSLKQLPLIRSLYQRKVEGVNCTLTYLNLVEKHLNINVTEAFGFHFRQENVPDFSSVEPSQVYSKRLGYKFYLKHCRPLMASKMFFMDFLRNGNLNDEAKSVAQKKVFRMAIKNFHNVTLAVSCLSFLEVIGVGSNNLKVYLKTASFLRQSGISSENVISMLLNVENDPLTIQSLLDQTIVNTIDFHSLLTSGTELITAIRTYETLAQFSQMHQLPLPENFLRQLCQHNLWLPFLLYAQMKNYPANQVKELCSSFKNPSLLEHVVHSVLHDFHLNDCNVSTVDELPKRQYPLSKLVSRRSYELPGLTRTRSMLSGSLESNTSSNASEFLEIDISNTKATLLQTLIRCHNSSDPPRALLQASQLYRNPLLAVLATSYEPDSVITNWLTWLAVSTGLYEIFTNFESLSSSSLHVTDLLDNCMKNRFAKTIFESCVIFIPDNPLTPFCDFLTEVIGQVYNVDYLTPLLEKFKSTKHQRRSSVFNQTDYELTYLKNKAWIELTALQLLCSALLFNTSSLFEQMEFIELLCQVEIQKYFSCEVPKFDVLLLILKITYYNEVQFNLAEFLNRITQVKSVEKCISQLVELKLFNEAFAVAHKVGLNTDEIILEKWKTGFDIAIQTEKFEDALLRCHEDFKSHAVSPDLVSKFFNDRESTNDLERYHLLKFSHQWASTHSLPNSFDLESKKILTFIKARESAKLDISELDSVKFATYTTYSEMTEMLKNIEQPRAFLRSDYLEKLDKLLIEALDRKDFWLALKLEKMFGLENGDLDVLKLCHELAEGLVLPHQLSEEQQGVLARAKEIHKITRSRRRRFKSISVSSDTNLVDLIEDETETVTDTTLGLIHSLIEKLTHGADLAYNVLMKYRISTNIELPYDIVISNTDYVGLLKNALRDDCNNKLEVVYDFFEAFDWRQEDVTDFVCDQFVSAAAAYAKSKIEIFSLWDVKVVDQFHLISKLVKGDCSTLGYKFYNYASAVYKQQLSQIIGDSSSAGNLNFKISEMALVVELLIAAHTCFTNDCNMEGISTILRKCGDVIQLLLKVHSWKLIVRLLTGVGRYTELNYVFSILKQNDQFEFLLSKASKKDERLKTACIEYLKKFCPDDRKLYELVATYFNLYSETASIWEREAQGYIKNLLAIALAEMQNNKSNAGQSFEFLMLTKSHGTHLLLQNALDRYVMAAKFHSNGEKLTNAMNAVKQAELLALQKSLLKDVNDNETVPSLLNLTRSKVLKLISNDLSFHQSNILTQAYNYTPDWSQVLYDQVMVNNNLQYFDDYVSINGVTDELIQDVAAKFCTTTATMKNFDSLKHIVKLVESPLLKYRLASEFGFSQLASEVTNSDNDFYLKDTVYKAGYRNLME